MNEIVIKWDGTPVAKGRARSFGFRKGNGKIGVGHYTPDATVEFEARMKYAAHLAMQGRAPLDGPIVADIDFRFPLPASAKKAARLAVEAGAMVPHIVKPDKDNLMKSLFDALNGVAVVDDKLIFSGLVTKRYAKDPGITVNLVPFKA